MAGLRSVGRRVVDWVAGRGVAGSRNADPRAAFVPRDGRLADGEVGLVPMAAARSEADPTTGPYRRFAGFEPMPGEARRPALAVADHHPPLLGRVAVVSLFLGRDGVGWSPKEIRSAHRYLTKAGEWIEREARRWGAAVNVDLAEVYFDARDDRPATDAVVGVEHPAAWDRSIAAAFHDPAARFSAAARVLGCADAVELTARVADRIEADHRVWLLHHRSAGRSCAYPGDLSDLPGVTFAVCYARDHDHEDRMAGEPYANPITVVHELLHLFGASDKYERSLSSFTKGSVTDRDVMRLDTDYLSRLRADPLTAAEVGWASPGVVLPPDPPRRRGDVEPTQ